MAFYVELLVRGDPDPVFDWARDNIPASDIIRQIARGTNVDSIKQGAIIATCPESNPEFGWIVKTVVRSRESVHRIVAFWEHRVERCVVIDYDAAVSRWGASGEGIGTFSIHYREPSPPPQIAEQAKSQALTSPNTDLMFIVAITALLCGGAVLLVIWH